MKVYVGWFHMLYECYYSYARIAETGTLLINILDLPMLSA